MSNLSQFVKPEPPPKYFAIDFDETFHAKDEEVMKRNVEAFAEVKKKGYTPFFCTGRMVGEIMDLLGSDFTERTSYKGYPGIYSTGAVVYDCTGNVLYSRSFSKEFIKVLCEFVAKEGSSDRFVFSTENHYYSLNEVYEDFYKALKDRAIPIPEVKTLEELLNVDILMVTAFCDKVELPGLKNDVDYVEKIDVNGTCDLSPPGVSKAVAIRKLMEYLQVPTEECAFIGDGNNDVEAMYQSDTSFAIGNATDYVKGHAKWVMDETFNEGAVARALALVYGPFA